MEREDAIITALKKRYFELAGKENYPHTPEITKECDHLEEAIKQMQKKPV
jgi:hypothetical protein